MKKLKIIFISVFLAITNFLIAENFSLEGYYYCGGPPDPACLIFQKNNKLKIEWINERDSAIDDSKIYSYKKKYIGRFPLFVLNEDIPHNLRRGVFRDDKTYYGNKFMLLTGQSAATELFDEDVIALCLLPNRKGIFGEEFFWRTPTGGSDEYWIHHYKSATSFLSENGRDYRIQNLTDILPDTPWVEGVDGWGIGESFVMVGGKSESTGHILLMNGYISATNPHLYEENGRIKKIEVKGIKSGKKKNFIIKDTPHPQSVDINFLDDAEDIKITILDVYKGAKYQDTALHFMILWRSEVIPYE